MKLLISTMVGLLTFSACLLAGHKSERFSLPCPVIYVKALDMAKADYRDVVEVAPGQTISMRTTYNVLGPVTLTVHFAPDGDGCAVQVQSPNHGVVRDRTTFLKRLKAAIGKGDQPQPPVNR
jgi:hypothetical protein